MNVQALTLLTLSVVLAIGLSVASPGTALADANANASCVGLEFSSISPPGSSEEFPGGAAQAAHEINGLAEALSLPPGALYSLVARLHAGSHEACDVATGG